MTEAECFISLIIAAGSAMYPNTVRPFVNFPGCTELKFFFFLIYPCALILFPPHAKILCNSESPFAMQKGACQVAYQRMIIFW